MRRCATGLIELTQEAMTPEERKKSEIAFQKTLNEIRQRREKKIIDQEEQFKNNTES